MYENYISILVKECGFQSYQQKYCIIFQMSLISFLKMFSYLFLYKSLQGLAQVNRTWLTLIVGYGLSLQPFIRVIIPVLQKAEKCKIYQEIEGFNKGIIILQNL